MPPPGKSKDKKAEQNFANFMTSTAGGTQGSSSYGNNPPSGSFSSGSGSGNQNNQSQEEIIQQAQQNFQNQQQEQEKFEKKQEEEKKINFLDQINEFVTKKRKIPSLPFSPVGIFANTIQGLDAKKTLLTNLKNKNITGTDKDTLARLLAMERMQGTEFITDDDLKDLDDESMGIFENLRKDITNIPTEDIQSYIDRMDDMGFGETVGTMYGDLTGKRDTSGITTLENITDDLGSEGLAYLKLTDPKTYYRLRPAQTSEQMRDLANVAMPTGNSPEDRRFAAQIMEAREIAAKSKESQDRASGIMTASSAPPVPPPVIPPVIPPGEDTPPENPILNPVMSQKDPFDLAKFYASLPQYTQQGVMSPNLMEYYRNLGLFPRA